MTQAFENPASIRRRSHVCVGKAGIIPQTIAPVSDNDRLRAATQHGPVVPTVTCHDHLRLEHSKYLSDMQNRSMFTCARSKDIQIAAMTSDYFRVDARALQALPEFALVQIPKEEACFANALLKTRLAP